MIKTLISVAVLGLCVMTADAVTINNQNSNQIHYTIYTNAMMTQCAEGHLSPGQPVTWTTAGSAFWHPLCGGDHGPAHVEVSVYGAIGPTVNCTEHGSHNPRLKNSGSTVTVKSTAYGVECYKD